MKQILDNLNELKKVDNEFNYDKLKLFILEEISYDKLKEGLKQDDLYKLKCIINNIMNFNKKDYYFYIELPKSVYFTTLFNHTIYKTKLKSMGINGNIMEIVEPNTNIKYINDLDFIEISNIDKGIDISCKDWFYIISKYSYLYDRLYNYTFDIDIYRNLDYKQLKYYIDKRIKKELNDYKINNYLDKIEFIYRYDYVNDSINCFEDMLIIPKISEDTSSLYKTLNKYKH